MNRSTRTLIVVAIAVLVASAATYLVFLALKSQPVREVEVASAFAVVAAKPLPLGTRITAADVKVVPWPAASLIPGGFTSVDQVIDRGVLNQIAENEPLNGNNIAGKGAGAGLPPTIPPGMRAISVRVNEVIGVAGFVVQGTRVDVMVILSDGPNHLARVVVNNVTVLAAGTNYDQNVTKDGKAIPSSVVTLMVSPEDAEKIGLASTEGQIMLTLRNPLDVAATESRGMRSANLRSGSNAPEPEPAAAGPRPARRPVAAPAPPPPPPPQIYVVESIRGAKRTQETIK